MARINFDDDIDSDYRFKRLVRKIGDEDKVNGMLLRFWRIAQKYWGNEESLVPEEIFAAEELGSLLECGLAEIRPEGVYAKGSEKRFAWYLQKVRAGKIRAEAPRDEQGCYLPCQPAESDFAGQDIQRGTIPHQRSEIPHQPLVPVPVPVLAPVIKKRNKEKDKDTQIVGAPAPPPAPPVKRSKFDEPTRHKMRAFFDAYASAYKEKYGGQPEGIRDPALIGKVGYWVASISEEKAIQLAQVFLQIDYRPITESCHDLWQFFRHLNRIGIALSQGQEPGGIDWGKVFGATA